jgi:hypothetical protein
MVRDTTLLLWPWPSRVVRKTGDTEHPKRIGDRSTLAIMLALQDVGFELLLPFGENTRYDLVIDIDSQLLSPVQDRPPQERGGLLLACSTYGHHRNPATARRTYANQVDLFWRLLPRDERCLPRSG